MNKEWVKERKYGFITETLNELSWDSIAGHPDRFLLQPHLSSYSFSYCFICKTRWMTLSICLFYFEQFWGLECSAISDDQYLISEDRLISISKTFQGRKAENDSCKRSWFCSWHDASSLTQLVSKNWKMMTDNSLPSKKLQPGWFFSFSLTNLWYIYIHITKDTQK